ncbi:unnamed protein product [Cuscuta campestris]|uniref:F-box domain-containing protein n=1 Tax=Cuscuta campestris TaxID=132261 RepID=A0A484NIL8_9ASTE|nr:unnamed protein product [Cuscuta campestris]
MDHFSKLPLDCMSEIISLTSPPDAAAFCLISKRFKSALESNAVWKKFLPPDIDDVLSESPSTTIPWKKKKKKKDLYLSLSHSPILLDRCNLITPDGDVRSVHSKDEDWDVPQAQKKLKGKAVQPEGSRSEINSFDELAEVFQEKFKENCTKRKKFTYLSTVGQREHEDLTKFLTRWKDEVDKVEEMDDKTAMSLLVSGLRFGELYKEFCWRPPQSYQEAYNTAWDYADAEAQVSSKREAEQGHSKGKISLKKEIELPGRLKTKVLEVKPVKTEKKPAREKQWTEKYCSFHKTDSHNTAECNSVKGVIKQMIEAGELDPKYLAQAKPKKNQWVKPEGQPAEENNKSSTEDRKGGILLPKGRNGGKSSTSKRSVNVLYLDAFEKLKLFRTRLEPLKTPLSGFTGDSVEAEGSILLTCELGTGDMVVQEQMRFVVVNIKCVHNAILGWPGINKVRGIISMAHLCMKFHTPGGIGQVRGDQKKARSCYLEAVKKMTKAFERVTLVSQEEDRSKLEPGDETEQIVLREAFPKKMVRIGRDLPGGLREEIISVLREYADIFAWSVADMPGIDRSVICHRLAVMEGSRLVKQKKRYLANVRKDFVKKEVKDLLSVGHIREVKGEMEVKEERLARYSDLVRALLRELEEFRLTRIPRSENTDADMLSKLMQACPEHVSKLAKIEILDQPSADRFEVAVIQPGQSSATGVIEADDDWRYDLMEYLETARLPVEAKIPTFRETVYQPGQNEVDHLAELNLMEERRTIAAVKMAGYQQSVKRYHDNRVGPRYFQVHDEVLRRRDASKLNERGKLVRNWEGPYCVRAIIRPGT